MPSLGNGREFAPQMAEGQAFYFTLTDFRDGGMIIVRPTRLSELPA